MIYDIVATIAAGAALAFGPLDEDYFRYTTPTYTGEIAVGSTYDSGQIRYVPNMLFYPSLKSTLVIRSGGTTGELTIPSTPSPDTGYSMANLGKRVSKISGTFVLHPGTASYGGNGTATFIVWNSLPNGTNPPNSGFHFSMTRLGWQILAFVNNGFPSNTPVAVLGTNGIGFLDRNGLPVSLVADGVTQYQFAAQFNADGTATLTLPPDNVTVGPFPLKLQDGTNNPYAFQSLSGTLPSFVTGIPAIGNYPCWEVYQANAGDDRAGFIRIHAE